MFRTINSKFISVTVVLILLFTVAYALFAFFLHKERQNSLSIQENVAVSRDVLALQGLFHKTRFWERAVLSQARSEAAGKFGANIAELRGRLTEILDRESEIFTKEKVAQALRGVNQYENDFNNIVQFKTEQQLNYTRINTTYRALSTSIIKKEDSDFSGVMFNLSSFLDAYRHNRRQTEFKALKIMIAYIENRLLQFEGADDRVAGYIRSLSELLEKDFALEKEIQATNYRFDEISTQLMGLFSEISQISEAHIEIQYIQAYENKEKINRIFLFSSIVGILFLLLILGMIAKTIINPIRAIAEIMREVTSGNIQARFALAGNKKEEIMRFGISFNKMLDTLEKNNQKLVKYKNELESKNLIIRKAKSRFWPNSCRGLKKWRPWVPLPEEWPMILTIF